MPGTCDGPDWWDENERLRLERELGGIDTPQEGPFLFRSTELALEAVLGPDTSLNKDEVDEDKEE